MGPGVLEDCANCHNAHDFHVEDTNCLACHEEVFRDAPPEPGSIAASLPASPRTEVRATALHAGFAGVGAPPGGGAWWLHRAPEAPQQEAPRFVHADHRNVACTSCHDASQSHGGLKVTSIADCRGCHHTAPVSANCVRCHQSGESRGDPHTETRTLTLSVRAPVERSMPFAHENHTTEACSTCHTRGLALQADQVDCNQCHEQHHALDNDCASCHTQPPVSAHPVVQAHQTCSGSGCHDDPPFQTLPTTTREACLVCHQEQRDHRPGQVCAECHAVTESGPGRGR
jgi:hypothetical protein